MNASSERRKPRGIARAGSNPDLARQLSVVLSVVALAYALLAGLRTVMDYDLGWQMATGRWVAQHRQIPSTDVFSYTAQGQPWIYPVGAGLFFYAGYLVGKYALLAWLGAAACAGTVALLIWKRSAMLAALAVLAIPMIALRSAPRAEMFTVVLFAAFLTVLWRQHASGRAHHPSKPKPDFHPNEARPASLGTPGLPGAPVAASSKMMPAKILIHIIPTGWMRGAHARGARLSLRAISVQSPSPIHI